MSVCVRVCVYFMCVFMAAARSPTGRVLGPIERVTTPAASEETSSAPLWRKPEWTAGEKQINHRNGEQRTKNLNRARIYQTVKSEKLDWTDNSLALLLLTNKIKVKHFLKIKMLLNVINYQSSGFQTTVWISRRSD